jgi:hypothetical protein
LVGAVSPVKVEKLLKRFKTYRCAMDFDSAFCKAVFCDDNGHNVRMIEIIVVVFPIFRILVMGVSE